MLNWLILEGDARAVLAEMPAASVQTAITSPPYFGLRDYGHPGQIGLEGNIDAYVAALVAVFRAVRRVLRPDGTLWLNLGDSYSHDRKWGGRSGGKNTTSAAGGYRRAKQVTGLGEGQLLLMPARVALALQADGWILRSEIIWHKRKGLPESVTDRPTKAHEQIYLFAQQRRYYYDAAAIAEPQARGSCGSTFTQGKTGIAQGGPGRVSQLPRQEHDTRNKRDVWSLSSEPYADAHFATFPPALIEPCILAGSRPGETVLDPFSGAGTTVLTALRHGRRGIGIELNPAYVALSRDRIVNDAPLFNRQEIPA